MQTLTVALGDRAYPIHIGNGLLNQPQLILPHLKIPQVAIVMVATLLAERPVASACTEDSREAGFL